MATTSMSAFLRRLTRGMVAESLQGQSDQQLVHRLVAGYEAEVFETIVRRHGPMVYRVCWRVLQQENDTEDAFQATFLILARQIHTLQKRTSLACWLHGIAHRVALKSRSQAATRRRFEPLAASEKLSRDVVSWSELLDVLDSELRVLPEKWRSPLVLCYLEARTQDEAAKQLGWSQRTLRRRLEEAREALKRRLTARGVIWPCAFSAVLLTDFVAPASLVQPLVGSTVELVTFYATGQGILTAGVSTKVCALADGVIQSMLVSKVIASAALVFLTGGGLLAAAHFYQLKSAESPNSPKRFARGAVQSAPANPVVVHEGAILQRMAMSPDGQEVATVGVTHDGSAFNSTVKIWDIRTGKVKQTTEELKDSHLEIALTNEYVAIAGNEKLHEQNGPRKVRLLDAKTLQLKHVIDETLVPGVGNWSALAFSPDGKRLAMAGFGEGPTVQLWDIEKQKLLDGKADLGENSQELKAVACLAFSPDGNLVATAWREGGIRLFDGGTGKFVSLLDQGLTTETRGLGAGGIAFSPDSKTLASACGDGTLILWDLRDGKKARTLKCHNGRVDAVAFSKDGQLIATGGNTVPGGQTLTKNPYEVALWDAKTGEAKRTFRGLTEWIHVVAFSSDSKTLVVCGGAGSDRGKGVETSGDLTFFHLK